MEQAAKDRVQQELADEAEKLIPGVVRQVAVLEYGDDPMVEPGEVMVRVTTASRPGHADEPPNRELMKQFRQQLSQRLPEVRRVEVRSEAEEGRHQRFLARVGPDDRPPPDAEFTPVMVRMKAPELQVVDTLISAGIAPNRAEAVRWALARIAERPAYAQLRERTREIEQLKTEF